MISLIVVCVTVVLCTAIMCSCVEKCRNIELQRQELWRETAQLNLAAEKIIKEENN